MQNPAPSTRALRPAYVRVCLGVMAGACVVVSLVAAVTAHAVVGSIGVFSDPVGGDCNVADVAGVVEAEVVYVGTDGAAWVSFAVSESPGLQMSYVDEVVNFQLHLGNTRDGVAITFGACLAGPIHLLTLRYIGSGTTATCETIRVVPNPDAPSDSIEAYDCAQNLYTIGGGAALVRSDGGCGCSIGADVSSWGRIKALYRR